MLCFMHISLQYCEQDDLSIYNRLLGEIKNSGVDSERLWQSWHGDSHWIADDKLRWKEACPTFHMVLNRLADYFTMDIKVQGGFLTVLHLKFFITKQN